MVDVYPFTELERPGEKEVDILYLWLWRIQIEEKRRKKHPVKRSERGIQNEKRFEVSRNTYGVSTRNDETYRKQTSEPIEEKGN